MNKRYKFIAKEGMALIKPGGLFMRKMPTNVSNKPIYEIKYNGKECQNTLKYVGYVANGKNVGGIAKWFMDANENYFWAGNIIEESDTKFKFASDPLKNSKNVLEYVQGFGKEQTDPKLLNYYKKSGFDGHMGIDFRTRNKDGGGWRKDVYAVIDGRVIEAGEGDYNGNYVRLEHVGGSKTVYCHLDSIDKKIIVGKRVQAGKIIGISGQSGSEGAPHLHFGYCPPKNERNDRNGYKGYVDPLNYLNAKTILV